MFNRDGCKNKAIDSNWPVCCESSYGLMPFFHAFPDITYRIHSIDSINWYVLEKIQERAALFISRMSLLMFIYRPSDHNFLVMFFFPNSNNLSQIIAFFVSSVYENTQKLKSACLHHQIIVCPFLSGHRIPGPSSKL